MLEIKLIRNQKGLPASATPKALQAGITLIEVVVCAAIFVILSVSIYGVFSSIINGIVYYREKTTISSIADQYLEIVRNMPYSQIGTIKGNPNGPLPDLPDPVNLTINGKAYYVYYAVSYVDDPADGTALAGTDSAPDDYKQVKLYVQNVSTGVTSSFLTNVSPKGLEGLASGGALSLQVINANGQPVPGATLHITNTSVSPNIDVTRTTDSNGDWIEVGLPDSTSSYHIVASKAGYSVDQTYPITTQNPNPVKPDATISNGQVTQISFAIDQTSSLTFETLSQSCATTSGVGMEVHGAKLIYNAPNAVYKFDNTYTSDSNGQIHLGSVEWDSYTPSPTGSLMVYGSSPIQQATILPGTTQNFSLILGPKTDNSLLTIVKDASTKNPIQGAEVDLQTTVAPDSYTITASAGANGSISPSGATLVNSGSSQTFTITPNSGYSVLNVSADGVSQGAISSYTFSDVLDNHAISASFIPNMSWLSGWSYRKKITISNTNVGSADLPYFPLLVKISGDSDMKSALATGYDIRFTDSTGSALLPYERENWSEGNGNSVTANFWVQVPVVSHFAATTIYIYYGNSSAADGQNTTGVWDSNFAGVWHLDESSGSNYDSTSNGRTATVDGTPSVVTGFLGNAKNYTGSGDNNSITSVPLSGVSYTIDGWFYYPLVATSGGWRTLTRGSSDHQILINASNHLGVYDNAGGTQFHDSGYAFSGLSTGWHHIAVVANNSAPSSTFYVDGAQAGSVIAWKSNDNVLYFGNYQGGGQQWGKLDEFRISTTNRSVGWIKFEYCNMMALTSSNCSVPTGGYTPNEITFAGQETVVNTYTITAVAGADGTITPSGSVSVNSGASQTFLITPSYGYHVLNVLADGSSMGAVNSYTFNNVTVTHTISVTFEPTIISGGYTVTGFTDGSIWSQNDWSGGSGQADFSNVKEYYQDDGGIDNSTPSQVTLAKIGSSYVPFGSLISSVFDTGTDLTSYTILSWQPTDPDPSTAIKFQVAASSTDDANTTWNFSGPSGPGSYYTTSGTTMVEPDGITGLSGRYVRYKVFLSTTNTAMTPYLTSVNINYVSGCASPGQVMLPNLSFSPDDQATISKSGYQTQVIGPLNIKGYRVLQVLLNH